MAMKTKKRVLNKKAPSGVRATTPGSGQERDTVITNPDERYTYRDSRALLSLIGTGQATEAVRTMVRTSDGNVSTDVATKVAIANSGYIVTAYDAETGVFNYEATLNAANILKSLGRVYDYTKGFVSKPSMAEVIRRMLIDVQVTGAAALELVMDKDRLPDFINTIAYDYVRKVSRGDGTWYPRQELTGEDPVDLNYPNIFISEMNRDSGSAYAISPIIPAVPAILDLRVLKDDMERSINRAGHGRLAVTLNAEAILSTAPEDVLNDDAKKTAYLEAQRSAVATVVNGLNPEDAIIVFDSVEVETQDGSGSRSDWSPLLQAKEGAAATALKSNPSAMGMRSQGSQSLSNTESLIFLKHCADLQLPVSDVMSRALTLACRSLGDDVTVDFKFKPIDLRPENELEAFTTTRFNRLTDQLSIGLIEDRWFYHISGLPQQDTNLSGTGFRTSNANQGTAETTSGPQEDTLQPDNDVPRKGGGKDN